LAFVQLDKPFGSIDGHPVRGGDTLREIQRSDRIRDLRPDRNVVGGP